MPEPTLLGDIIQPAWQALTPEQRTCWHFWAAANPQYDELGRLRTLYGNQAHYSRNAWFAVAEGPALLADPPTTLQKPPVVEIETNVWPLKLLRAGGSSSQGGAAWIALATPNNNDVVIVVRQGYYKKKSGAGRPPRIRHVTVIQPAAQGPWDLTVPEGYFASTVGINRYATITGKNAKRRPDKPLGATLFIDIFSGEKIATILRNPYGGSRTHTNRPRATSVAPGSAVNHYP